MDTGLCGFRLCLLGGDIADGGVDPLTIVVAFDIAEQVTPRGIPLGGLMLVDEFGFQRAEEALYGCIIPSSFPCGSSIG
jgi:hypothetical protein